MKTVDLMVKLAEPNEYDIIAIRFIGADPSADDPLLKILNRVNRDGVRQALERQKAKQ